MPTFTQTAFALELAKAKRDALHEAAEIADRLGDAHPAVQAGALRALTTTVEEECDRLSEELATETAEAEARKASTSTAAPAGGRRRRGAAADQSPLEPVTPGPDADAL